MFIPPSVFNLHGAASKDTGRWQLSGVSLERIEGGKAKACATSGKLLVSAEWSEDDAEDFPEYPSNSPNLEAVPGYRQTIPNRECKKLAKMASGGFREILENVVLDERASHESGAVAHFSATDLDSVERLEPKVIDGDFPAYEPILADCLKTEQKAKLDVKLLQALLKVVEKTADLGNGDLVEMHYSGPDKPLVFVANGKRVTVNGAIMPVVKESGKSPCAVDDR
jgi:hypothetical protein